MIQTVFKRREVKFPLDRDQRSRLERAMRGHVVPDAYGPSTMCNVYCDTPTLLLARRSADHPAYKEKLRTRSYGVSDGSGPVFAELKKKRDGVVYKRRATLPPADADALLSGRREGATQIERELAFAAGRYDGLAPRVFVAYDREAFFSPDDHEFRMTFDRRVRARWERLSLCDGGDGDALLDEGVPILEVKCLEGMPLWLVRHLSAEGNREASWSKYVSACRARLARDPGALPRAAAVPLAGCSAATSEDSGAEGSSGAADATTSSGDAGASPSTGGTQLVDAASLFSDRDLAPSYDEVAATVTLSDEGSSVEGSGASVEGSTVTFASEGTYVVSGSLSDGRLVVDVADDEKVQLVLDGASVASSSATALYVRSADKVFLTLVNGSDNELSATGAASEEDGSTLDVTLFSRDDLTVNGSGSLSVSSGQDHGVVAKDELTLVSGTLEVEAARHALQANDSVAVADGSYRLVAGTDGIHCENADDDTAWVLISGGRTTIDAGGDGTDSNGDLTVTGGETYVSGPTSGADGALDYAGEGAISGGVLMAAGASGMAQNLGDGSTQVSMLVAASGRVGDAIALEDGDGTTLAPFTPTKAYGCVVVSAPGVEVGKTYVLSRGSSETEVTPYSVAYGDVGMGSMGMGGPGGMGMGGGPDGMGAVGGDPGAGGPAPEGGDSGPVSGEQGLGDSAGVRA